MAELYESSPGVPVETAAKADSTDFGFTIISPKLVEIAVEDPHEKDENGKPKLVTFQIKAWSLGQIGIVGDLLVQTTLNFAHLSQNWTNMDAETIFAVISILVGKVDVVWKAVAYTISKDVTWVSDLDGEDGINLIAAIVEVNKRFFRRVQTIFPTLQQDQERIEAQPPAQQPESGPPSAEVTQTGSQS